MPQITKTPAFRTPAAVPRRPQADETHTVRSGETIYGIARRYGVTQEALLAANPHVTKPESMAVGTTLSLPSSSTNVQENHAPAPTPNPATVQTNAVQTAAPRDRFVDDGQRSQTRSTSNEADGGRLQTNLRDGARGPAVREVQGHLARLGKPIDVDGNYGRATASAVRDIQLRFGLPITGEVDDATFQGLRNATPSSAPVVRFEPAARSASNPYGVFRPNAEETVRLFEAASLVAGVPSSWASDPALHHLLDKESDGRVGIPNYTFGDRKTDTSSWAGVHDELRSGRITTISSATGLGQLLLKNVEIHYPDGVAGIGCPLNEAVGMLRYIANKYETPRRALDFHDRKNWY